MGSKLCVAAEIGVAPMERLEEKGGGCAELREEESTTIALSPECTHSLPPPPCKPCHAHAHAHAHALPPHNQGRPTSLQEQQIYIQLEQEKKTYRLLNEETNCNLIDEIHFCKQLIVEKDHEILHLQRHLHHFQRLCAEENEKVQECQEKCRDLRLKLERAEHLYSQQSMADSGSYQDSAATPPLLQVAADSVKDAITVCASELFSRIKKNSLPINLALLNLDSKDAGQIIKFALQSFLCHNLFEGFEDPIFFASNGLPLFEKPAKRRTRFLQVYRRCRDLDARQMLDEEIDFALFFGVKESNLCLWIKEQLLMTDDVQKKEDFITSELRSRNNNYYSKLLRLAKAVWVLHKLAFAFEPSAEIFRVCQGSVLDEEFMEDVAGDDDEDDNEEEKMDGSVKRVRFMFVPGFTVRHTIIKSRVFSLKEDPSPMTVD